jgi:hypothetical protein
MGEALVVIRQSYGILPQFYRPRLQWIIDIGASLLGKCH